MICRFRRALSGRRKRESAFVPEARAAETRSEAGPAEAGSKAGAEAALFAEGFIGFVEFRLFLLELP